MSTISLAEFQAVIFDMDGLLLDTEAIYRLVWRQACAETGHYLSDEFYASFIGRPTADCELLLAQFFGADFPQDQCRVRRRALWQAHIDAHGVPLKSGVVELLEYLERGVLPKAIATSTGRASALEHLGELAHRFKVIVTGDEVKRGKPEPDIFLLAAERLGVAPERCLVLEDSQLGAEAALTAGMSVIIVPDLVQPSPEIAARAYRVCASLHAVKELLGAAR